MVWTRRHMENRPIIIDCAICVLQGLYEKARLYAGLFPFMQDLSCMQAFTGRFCVRWIPEASNSSV